VKDVKTLVCIRTDRKKTGDYSGGRSGFRLMQDVHIINWPEGKWLAAETFKGDSPGQMVLTSTQPGDPIYGPEPIQQLMNYVVFVID
jgi:hypothetical protein